jgi:hypothetical protein
MKLKNFLSQISHPGEILAISLTPHLSRREREDRIQRIGEVSTRTECGFMVP